MEFSAIGRAALVGREGCKLTAYQDSVGVWTIACGVTSASGLIVVARGLTITQAQADDLNLRAFEQYADQVRKLLRRPVTQWQFDALVSLNFNIGPKAFAGSTVLRKLNAGDVAGAAEAILMWNKPAAIVPRRQAEYDQFLTPYAQALPKARRGDAAPVKLVGLTGWSVAKSPVPAVPAPVAPAVPVAAKPVTPPPAPPVASPPKAPVQPASPAQSGGLSSVLRRLAALFGRPAA